METYIIHHVLPPPVNPRIPTFLVHVPQERMAWCESIAYLQALIDSFCSLNDSSDLFGHLVKDKTGSHFKVLYSVASKSSSSEGILHVSIEGASYFSAVMMRFDFLYKYAGVFSRS